MRCGGWRAMGGSGARMEAGFTSTVRRANPTARHGGRTARRSSLSETRAGPSVPGQAMAGGCRMGTWGTALVALGIVGVIAAPGALAQSDAALDRPVPRAECGPGSRPETGLQGQVPLADRQSGRSQKGYWCNLQLEGQSQNQGASWMFDSYDHCAYYDTNSYSGFGTAVIDAADPTRPRLTTQLQSPAMLGVWESL